ncbi:MAG: hypothetical protein PHC69_09045 [Ruminiclostridium sp.]|nr:hypothetical protein [Ruminiclostridium sp.]
MRKLLPDKCCNAIPFVEYSASFEEHELSAVSDFLEMTEKEFRERLFSLLNILTSASICPVVFEMLERLKKEYGFSKRRKRY